MSIPKIIHQTAPKDKTEWHPIWEKCHESWKKHFSEPEYQHILWDDDNIDSFINQHYSEYWEFYQNLPLHIMQLDFFRYCVLYQYGGIYADMDMFCYKNFFHELNHECYVVESNANNEVVQNSLMVSSKKNNFYKFCIEETIKNFKPCLINKDFNTTNQIESNNTFDYIYNQTGPQSLSAIFSYYDKKLIHILPKEYFNFGRYNNQTRTRHMLTGRWGKELRQSLKERHLNSNLKNLSHKEYLIFDYYMLRGIDVNNFDFYK